MLLSVEAKPPGEGESRALLAFQAESRPRVDLSQQLGGASTEGGKVDLYDRPNYVIDYHIVAMDEKVTECDDSHLIRNSLGEVRCQPRQLGYSLAHDRQLSLDRRAEQSVVLVVFDVFSASEICDRVGGTAEIP